MRRPWGHARADKGDLNGAIADFTRIIRKFPGDVNTLNARGVSRAQRGNLDDALKDFENAIRLSPTFWPAYQGRGHLWKKRGEIERALKDYTEASRIEPDNADLYRHQAWLLATWPDGKYRNGKRAVELATKACELSNWKNSAAIDTLAAACAEAGDFQAAIKWQKRAVEMAPSDDQARYRLGLYQGGRPFRDNSVAMPAPRRRAY